MHKVDAGLGAAQGPETVRGCSFLGNGGDESPKLPGATCVVLTEVLSQINQASDRNRQTCSREQAVGADGGPRGCRAGTPGAGNGASHHQDASAARPGLVVWTVGDLCDDDNDVPGCETVADLVAADPTATYFVPLGDNQYQNGSLSNYETYYHPKVGAKLNAITKPIPGNHEYVTPEAAGYYDYFGAKAGDPDKGYYSVEQRRLEAHLPQLQLPRKFDDGCDYTSVQAEWLDDQLRGPETCEIVFTHYPPISDGEYAPGILRMGGFWRHAHENHAELFISGHDHGYQRFSPRGAAFTRARRRHVAS